MYSPNKRQRELIQRTLTYIFMTIVVLASTLILILVVQGYRFDNKKGTLDQGALLQFASKPTGATVTVDNSPLNIKTPTKVTVAAGNHNVSIQRKGYRSWHKQVNVKAADVRWLNYARLVPEVLTSTLIADYEAVASSLASPDKKRLAVWGQANLPQFELVDIAGSDVQRKVLNLPEVSVHKPADATTESYTLQSWDKDGRYLLVRHAYEGTHEWILVDTRDIERTVNLSSITGKPASDVRFSLNGGRVVYALIDHAIYKIEGGDKMLKKPLIEHVAEYSFFDKTSIMYTTLPHEATGLVSVGYYTANAARPQVIKTFPAGAAVHAIGARYFGDDYVLISNANTISAYKTDLPASDNMTSSPALPALRTITTKSPVEGLSTNVSERFVAAKTTEGYLTYDLETDVVAEIALSDAATIPRWIDEYHLRHDADGVVQMIEFDGKNAQLLVKAEARQVVSLNPDGTYLYYVDAAAKLNRVRMILP